jgi:hypothetical protein
MGADVSDPLVVPAWWIDPQSPKFRRDILVGLLMVDDERFIFATPSGVNFNAPRSEARLEWRRGMGFGMIPRLDLSTPQGSFRLCLSPPYTGAPPYGRHIAAEAGEQLSQAGASSAAVPQRWHIAAEALSNAPLIGVVFEFRQIRRGRDAARALRAKISSPPPGRAPVR